ncbi:MAG: segregation/condensation protein A [archaeon]
MKKEDKVGQDQLYDLLTSRELGWKAIVYDLIKTEQLDPWDIDITLLSNKYIEKITKIQELGEGSFFITSKVLLAAALLLRIKSEILKNNLRSIDEILFEKKENKIELAKENMMVDFMKDTSPQIFPRTPMPRSKKVTLNELMLALNKAINTENRRIKRHISKKRAQTEIGFAVFPKKYIDLHEQIKNVFNKLKDFFTKKEKVLFDELLTERTKEEKIATFVPLLHLDNQKKVWLEQSAPFKEIEVWMKKELAERARTTEQH